jgi:pilus assembly protein FimV
MKHKTLALAMASGLSMMSIGADAASLGKITVFSALGQPLRAEIPISATRDELIGMKVLLATEEAYAQANVDRYPAVFNRLHLSIEKRPKGVNVIKITSGKAIDDPFLDFLVEINWPSGRLVREYTFLLDPPELQERAAQQAEAPIVGVPVAVAAPSQQGAPGGGGARAGESPAGGGAIPFPSNFTGEHRVKTGETLRGIAAANKPANVSLEQMLVAIYRSNTEAFIGNNVNRLRSGAVLLIPSEADVAVVPQKDARKVLYAHTAEWNKYRERVAANAPTGGGSSGSSGSSGGSVTGINTPPARNGQVEVRPTSGADTVAYERQIRELETRNAELTRLAEQGQEVSAKQDKLIKELEKTIAVTNEKLAKLEREAKELAEKKNSSEPVVTPELPPEPPSVEEPEVSPSLPQSGDVSTETPQLGLPTTTVEESSTAQQPEVAPPPPSQPPAPPPVEEVPEGSSLPLYLVIGFLAAATVFGGVLLLRNVARKAKERSRASIADVSRVSPLPSDISRVEESTSGTAIQTPVAQSVDTVGAGSSGASTDDISSMTGSSIFSRLTPDAMDVGGEVDPINEAELYLGYGKDEQAEEILLDALQKEPDRLAISVKLLEVYARRKSVKQFEALAQDLRARTGGVGEEWAKVAALGQELDPQNPLYVGSKDKVTDTLVESGWDGVFAPELPSEEKKLEESNSLDFTTQTTPVFSPVREEEPEPEPKDSGHTLDFSTSSSFSFDTVKLPEETPKPLDIPDATGSGDHAGSEDITKTDFDLESFTRRSSSREEFSQPEDATPDLSSLYAERPVESVKDADPSLPVPAFESVPPVTDFHDDKLGVSNIRGLNPETDAANATDEVQFDANLTSSTILGNSMFEPSEIEFDASLTESTVLADPLAGIDLNLAQQPEPAPILSEPIEAPPIVAPPAAAPFDDALRDEVNTKLELAQAYEDMGDVEGARELLNEVLGEGAPDQKAQAQEILNRLG